MKEHNINIFEEKIEPALNQVAKKILPGRWEDVEDIQQELKVCALKFIDWAEKKNQAIAHPNTVIRRAMGYVISGRRTYSQKTSDILHTHKEDDNIHEYDDFRTTGTSIKNPAVAVQLKCDVEEIYRMLGKDQSEILDMSLCGYSNGQIAKRFGISEPRCSELRKNIQKTIKTWLARDAQETINKPANRLTDDHSQGISL